MTTRLVQACFAVVFVGATLLAQAGPQQGAAAPVVARITQGPTVEYSDDQFAVVTWMTTSPGESRVYFGTTPDELNRVSENRTIGTIHRVDLGDLQPGTTYYFRIDDGQSATRATNMFRTGAKGAPPVRGQAAAQVTNSSAAPVTAASTAPPAQPPVLQRNPASTAGIVRGPSIQYADDVSAVIIWTTSAPAATRLAYGESPESMTHMAQEPGQSTTHRVHLSNLRPQTTYYFHVASGEAAPVAAKQSFRTVAAGAPPLYDQPPAPAPAQAASAAAPPQQLPAAHAHAPAAAQSSRQAQLSVPAGTEIEAKLKEELSTKTAHAGDTFTAEVTKPVHASDNSVAIPAGTIINGEVIEAESGKTLPMIRGKGRLSVRFRDLTLPSHTSYPLTATLLSIHGKNANSEGEVQSSTNGKDAAKNVGIGAGLGTVAGLIFGGALKGLAIGAIAGGGYVLATSGKDVEIPANAALKLRLDQPLAVSGNAASDVPANTADQ
jgi:Purple acid Phosphatase, N-terminal domain